MQQEIWFQKYKILGLLGRGGTASVYLAEHVKLNSYRAIKVISKNHPLYELQRNEALLLKNLKHSCIPIIYDIEEDEESSYIVEQYLEGNTLKDYVETKGAVREDIIIHFGIQICDLIHYLHSNPKPILYVDLKPENVILSGSTVKLIDFGSAVYQEELRELQFYSGTIGYAAPELYRQDRIDERCDVYGIGMLLYYMATGHTVKRNQAGIDHIDQAGSCSVRMKNIINKCLRYNPYGRYNSVESLNKHLSALIQKNQLSVNADRTMTIAIAGAQQRIGATHFAFRLSKYLLKHRYTCLYEEHNNHGCVHAMKNCYKEVENKEGIYQLEGISMRSLRQGSEPVYTGYQIIVQDYGCLNRGNMSEFLKADRKLLILGAKDWELEHSEQVLNMVAEYKDIDYLFNFLNGRQYQRVIKNMSQRNCFRISYEPDPFNDSMTKNDSDLFDELIPPFDKETLKKTTGFFRKRRTYETKTHAYK